MCELCRVNYFASGRKGEYCDDHVCSSVCPRAYLRNCTSDLHQILCMLPMSLARSSCGGVAIRYVFPVLWMTSYLHIMGHMPGCWCNTGTASQPDGAARRLGPEPWLKQLQAVSPQPYDVGCSKPGAKSAVCDCLIVGTSFICRYKYINIIWFCSNWLAMSNSCYNPFVYGLLNVCCCVYFTAICVDAFFR